MHAPRNKKGFTLIELLVVVAIVSVLSTLGIPIYRRIVQNSKKSEAQIALSVLYTTETGFYSEFGAYGNNLGVIGFEPQGNTNVYSVGFSATGPCTDQAPLPQEDVGVGPLIKQRQPNYYTTVKTVYPGLGNQCYDSGIQNNGRTFVASAMGNVAPGTDATDQADIWVINQNRVLQNCRDGINGGDDDPLGACADYDETVGDDEVAP